MLKQWKMKVKYKDPMNKEIWKKFKGQMKKQKKQGKLTIMCRYRWMWVQRKQHLWKEIVDVCKTLSLKF